MQQAALIVGLSIAALTVAAPEATAHVTCHEQLAGGPNLFDGPSSPNQEMICEGCPDGQGYANYGVECTPIPQMPATIPAGMTEASICADLMGSGGHIFLMIDDGEVDDLKAKGMTYNDAHDAVQAAIWHVCPQFSAPGFLRPMDP